MPSPLLLSVCIPAYNRSAVLPNLLDSIFGQDHDGFEVVIAEDNSPERSAIRTIASDYAERHPGQLRYHENSDNLGYDGNLRQLFDLARGDYVVLMGNDDLLCAGALRRIAAALRRFPGTGVVLRTYASFVGDPANLVQTYRYFAAESVFPPGADTIATVFRRAVVVSGLTIHRDCARALATTRFDGTLLYQVYLVGAILARRGAVYLPEVLALYRTGGAPDFGMAAAERGRFHPRIQTPESSLHFLAGMLAIARHVQQQEGLAIYTAIRRDIANYSYPFLRIQARQPWRVFIPYAWRLSRLGLGRSPLFWLYWLALLAAGPTRTDALIAAIKNRLGRTPVLGRVYRGEQR